MKLRLLIELDYEADIMHGDDQDAVRWFDESVLGPGSELYLHSQEIGDFIGAVSVLERQYTRPAP